MQQSFDLIGLKHKIYKHMTKDYIYNISPSDVSKNIKHQVSSHDIPQLSERHRS